jgi:hypothetical protein
MEADAIEESPGRDQQAFAGLGRCAAFRANRFRLFLALVFMGDIDTNSIYVFRGLSDGSVEN